MNLKEGDILISKKPHSCTVKFVEAVDEIGILLVDGVKDEYFVPEEFKLIREKYKLLCKKEDRIDVCGYLDNTTESNKTENDLIWYGELNNEKRAKVLAFIIGYLQAESEKIPQSNKDFKTLYGKKFAVKLLHLMQEFAKECND